MRRAGSWCRGCAMRTLHVESGMLTISQFVRAVLPHGTTSMFIDPHEIANVLGMEGVRLMHDEALEQPINVLVQMPSCAPSAPGLETTGFELGPEDVAAAMSWPNIVGLGEMMNFPGVAAPTRKCWARLQLPRPPARRLAVTMPRPTWVLHSTPMLRAVRPTTTRARVRSTRFRVSGRACAPCCGWGLPGTDVEAQITAVTKKGRRSPQLHSVHRRLPFRHAGE